MGLTQPELFICQEPKDQTLESEETPDDSDYMELRDPEEIAMLLYLIFYGQNQDFDMEFIM